MTVAIEAPVDEAAQTIATHVVRERLDEKGAEVRVVPAGDKLVVEVGEQDREIVAMQVQIIERTGKLEVHRLDGASAWLAEVGKHAAPDGIRVEQGIPVADDRSQDLAVADADKIGCTGRVENGTRHCMVRGDRALGAYVDALVAREAQLAIPPDRIVAYGRVADRVWRPYLLERAVILDGAAIRQADVLSGGVEINVAKPDVLAAFAVGTTVAITLDGTVKFVGAPDRIAATHVHLPTGNSVEAAVELVSVVEAGAARPMRVVQQDAFSRATGFLPRAWLFLAIGGVLLIVAALLWWRS